VIPRSTELSGLELVGLRVARSNWAFCNSIDAIVADAVVLTNTVPVHRGTVVLHVVGDLDLEMISPRGSNGGSRILAINQKAEALAVAIRIASRVGDREFMVDCLAGRRELLVEIGGNAETILPALTAEWTVCAS